MFVKKKIIIVFLLSACFLASCNCVDKNRSTENVELEESIVMETSEIEFVSIQQFRDYYQLDDKISDEDIEGFIFDYDVTQEKMEKYNLGRTLSNIISSGIDRHLGYDLSIIESHGRKSDKKLEEFIYDVNWIYITFSYASPDNDEFGYGENMVIDLKNKKIFFNSKINNYSEAELSKDLTDSDIEEIRREFPQNMGEYVEGIKPCLDYGYHICFVDKNKNQLNYNEFVSDEKNKAFDCYWKKLYQKYFGKDYSFPK